MAFLGVYISKIFQGACHLTPLGCLTPSALICMTTHTMLASPLNRDEEQIRYELYDIDESDEEEFDEQNILRTKSGREIRKPERFGDWTV